MNKKYSAFTLIELLVVIVIIGILSTISTATFSGYAQKTRDVERQTFVRTVQQVVLADHLNADVKDYSIYVDRSTINNLLQEQGYDEYVLQNGIQVYIMSQNDGLIEPTEAKANFLVFACRENARSELGSVGNEIAIATNEAEKYAIVSGTAPLKVGTAVDDDSYWITSDELNRACSGTGTTTSPSIAYETSLDAVITVISNFN